MKKEDELLIQNKIDGLLTLAEEGRFVELIEKSSQAREYYKELLELHRAIEHDSENIPVIDFSNEIMQAVNTKQQVGRAKSSFVRFSILRSNLLAYAAILFVGLFIGSIATYLGTSTNQPIDKNSLSGTIADEPKQNFHYNDDTTEIAVREIGDREINYTMIAINTVDSLQCCIAASSKAFTDKNIELWFTDGKFMLKDTTKNELQYLCSGSVVFQINRMASTNTLDPFMIRFIRNGLIINQLNVK